jgi:predicted glycoside hydrolase/deacetylase ChbG (UPF0249 family)
MRHRHVVVNADDFGLSRQTNAGILQAFEMGLISSATIMSSMPGFEEACQLVHRHRLNGKIGLHLNFTEGKPLTAAIADCPGFCDARGYWLPRRTVRSLTGKEARLLEAEILAQFQACRQQGITLTHWDSHNHMHWQLGFTPVVIRMAKRCGITGIRIRRNCGPLPKDPSMARRILTPIVRRVRNLTFQVHGLARTDYFGDAVDTAPILRATRSDVEVMVHPTVDENGRLIDLYGEDLQSLVGALRIPSAEMCSYQNL